MVFWQCVDPQDYLCQILFVNIIRHDNTKLKFLRVNRAQLRTHTPDFLSMHMYLGVNVCVHLRVNITVPAACKSSASASPFPPSGLLRKKNPALRCLSQGLPMPNIIRQDNLKLKFLCVNRAKFRTGTPDLHAHGFRYKCLCAITC